MRATERAVKVDVDFEIMNSCSRDLVDLERLRGEKDAKTESMADEWWFVLGISFDVGW